MAAFAVKLDARDLALDADRAVLGRHIAQEFSEARGVELIGVVHPVVRQMGKLALQGGDQLQAVVVIRRGMALFLAVEPEMLEARRPVVLAGQSERVEVPRTLFLPVVEQDAELEGRLGGAHELGLVDAEQTIEGDERRNGRFPHPDRADGVGFDQGDADRLAKRTGDGSGRHPSGGPASGDDDAIRVHGVHWLSCLNRKPRMRAALSGVSGARTLRPPSGMCSTTSGPFPKM